MTMSGMDVKRKLWSEGSSLKKWAAEHGYNYEAVSRIVSGRHRGNYGKGYEIAVALGMKDKLDGAKGGQQ